MATVICVGCERYIDLDTTVIEYIGGEFYHWQCAERYIDWEDDNPRRTPKSAKPTMGISGQSLKTVISRIIGKKKRRQE